MATWSKARIQLDQFNIIDVKSMNNNVQCIHYLFCGFSFNIPFFFSRKHYWLTMIIMILSDYRLTWNNLYGSQSKSVCYRLGCIWTDNRREFKMNIVSRLYVFKVVCVVEIKKNLFRDVFFISSIINPIIHFLLYIPLNEIVLSQTT